MIVNPVSSSRQQWYDRNPLDKTLYYGGGSIAPHGNTSRDSYTVPANRKATIYSSLLKAYRETVATAVDIARAYVAVTPSGGSAMNVNDLRLVTNALYITDYSSVNHNMYLSTGDNVDLRTVDNSTGGTVIYLANVIIVEYDA